MRRTSSLAFFVAAAMGCSSSGSSSGTSGAPALAACQGDLPDRLSISAGGRLSFTRKEGIAYEGTGGAVVTADDTTVAIRAPYAATGGEEVALRLDCGRTIAIDVRPLTWTKLAKWEEEKGAPAREYGAWWLDPEGTGALIVFGGYHYVPKQFTPSNDAWRFDFATATWAPLAGDALPTLPGARVAPIPGERAVLFFGGTTPTEDRSIDTHPSLYRLAYDDTTLTPTKIDIGADAPASYTGALVYDSKRQRWLSLCGASSTTGLNCTIHAYAPTAGFVEVMSTSPGPKGRYGFHYAYDEATDRVILFGGQNGTQNDAIDGETWALDLATDPPTWTRLFANGKGPTKRRNGAFALDPVGHRLFVWGGTPDGASSLPNLQALSLDRGAEQWSDIDVPSDVPMRTSALGVHDAARDRLVFGFGNDRSPYRDLWSVDVGNVNPR
jgi:Galactose oxidase, central domain